MLVYKTEMDSLKDVRSHDIVEYSIMPQCYSHMQLHRYCRSLDKAMSIIWDHQRVYSQNRIQSKVKNWKERENGDNIHKYFHSILNISVGSEITACAWQAHRSSFICMQ